MIKALTLSIAQLGDRRIVGVLAKSVVLTLLIFAMLFALLWRLVDGADPCGWFGWSACALGGGTATATTALAGLLSLWFLFPPVAIAIIGLFSDAIVDAVEARHYPDARAMRQSGWGEAIGLALRSAGRLLIWNIVAIPGYLLLMVTGIGPFLLFMAINAIALGRDMGEMVAVRHLDVSERQAWFHSTKLTRMALGAVVTGAFLVPFINLLAPVLGAAMATHVFHQTRS